MVSRVSRPPVSTALDYEGELAVVVGRGWRYIKAADAMTHVAGYARYNDAALCDWQRHTMRPPSLGHRLQKRLAGTGSGFVIRSEFPCRAWFFRAER